MSNNLEPKQGDRIEKPVEPDVKKGRESFTTPPKPQAPPQKPMETPSKPKK